MLTPHYGLGQVGSADGDCCYWTPPCTPGAACSMIRTQGIYQGGQCLQLLSGSCNNYASPPGAAGPIPIDAGVTPGATSTAPPAASSAAATTTGTNYNLIFVIAGVALAGILLLGAAH